MKTKKNEGKIVFEIVLKGFDGSTDESDNKILWAVAVSSKIVEKYCKQAKLNYKSILPISININDPGIDFNL